MAEPLKRSGRVANYLRQTGGSNLTPAQRRRIEKKYRKATGRQFVGVKHG